MAHSGLGVGGNQSAQRLDHPAFNFFGPSDPFDPGENSGSGVIVQQRPGRRVIDLEAMAHSGFGVVFPLVKLAAALVACVGFARRSKITLYIAWQFRQVRRPEIRLTISSSGTITASTRSIAAPRPFSIAPSNSACGTDRGNPSRINPL